MDGVSFQRSTEILYQCKVVLQSDESLPANMQSEEKYSMYWFGITKIILQICDKQVLVFLYILSNIYKNLRRSKFEIISWTDNHLRITEKPTSLCEGRGLALWVFHHKTVILWLTNLGFCDRTTKRLALMYSSIARGTIFSGALTASCAPFSKKVFALFVITDFTEICSRGSSIHVLHLN